MTEITRKIRFNWIGDDPLHPREIDAIAKIDEETKKLISYTFPAGTNVDDLFVWMELATDPKTTYTILD